MEKTNIHKEEKLTKEGLKASIIKDNKVIERCTYFRTILKRSLIDLISVALLYVVVIVLLPILCHKSVDSLREFSLMIFAAILLLMMLVILILSSRIIDIENNKLKKTKELYKLVHPRKAAQMENKNGKEVVSK